MNYVIQIDISLFKTLGVLCSIARFDRIGLIIDQLIIGQYVSYC
jgi:hypothetical protein